MLQSLKNEWDDGDQQSQESLRTDGRRDFGVLTQPADDLRPRRYSDVLTQPFSASPPNDPLARIEVKLDRALAEIGELRLLVAGLRGA